MSLRFLHTADWHIGQTLQGFPREAEQAAALGQVVDLARETAVDALIVAGDVFDRETPSPRAENLFYRTLVRLRLENPRLQIVVVAGNHDSPGRIEAPNPLYGGLGVHAVGHVARRGGKPDMGRHLIALRDRAGEAAAHVLALPYLHAAYLPGYGRASDEPGSPVVREVRALYAEAVAGARETIGDAPLIATGHLHIQGGEPSEGAERNILAGGAHAVPADIFDKSLVYVALGHLHKPHAAGAAHIRYSGALIPLSASEISYRHGVSLVELTPAGARVEHVPITRPVPFLRVPAQGALPQGDIDAALRFLALDPAIAPDQRPFVQLHVRLDGPAPGLKAELDRLAEAFPIRLVGHAVERAEGADPAGGALPAPSLSGLDPADLFRQAFLGKHGSPPGQRHLQIFHAALSEA